MAVGRRLVTPGHPGRRSRQPLIWTSTSGGRSGRSPYPPEGDWEHQAVEDFCPYTQRMTEVGNTASGPVHLPRSRRVAMLNQKGGVGKTTSTVNLGHGLARAGYRVCLVDLDLEERTLQYQWRWLHQSVHDQRVVITATLRLHLREWYSSVCSGWKRSNSELS